MESDSEKGTDKWIADGSATFHMVRSADSLLDVQPSNHKVSIGNDCLIDVESYGSLVVDFPNLAGGISVNLDKMVYVPDLVFTLFHSWPCTTRG